MTAPRDKAERFVRKLLADDDWHKGPDLVKAGAAAGVSPTAIRQMLCELGDSEPRTGNCRGWRLKPPLIPATWCTPIAKVRD